jgi:hypothetical protein
MMTASESQQQLFWGPMCYASPAERTPFRLNTTAAGRASSMYDNNRSTQFALPAPLAPVGDWISTQLDQHTNAPQQAGQEGRGSLACLQQQPMRLPLCYPLQLLSVRPVMCCNACPATPDCCRPAPVDAVQLEEAAVARVQAAVAERFAAAIASEEVSQ